MSFGPISLLGPRNIFVGASFKILDIQQYASGFKLVAAAILNQNPIFEIASTYDFFKDLGDIRDIGCPPFFA
jgi:hypothetical protein